VRREVDAAFRVGGEIVGAVEGLAGCVGVAASQRMAGEVDLRNRVAGIARDPQSPVWIDGESDRHTALLGPADLIGLPVPAPHPVLALRDVVQLSLEPYRAFGEIGLFVYRADFPCAGWYLERHKDRENESGDQPVHAHSPFPTNIRPDASLSDPRLLPGHDICK